MGGSTNVTPTPPPPLPVDPNLAPAQDKAQGDLIASLRTQAAGDTASIMARYGTRLALAQTMMPQTPGVG